MRKRTDRTGEFSNAHCLNRFVEPRLLTLHLIVEKGKFQSERRRFRMNTVRAAYHDSCFELISAFLQNVEQALKIFKNDRRRVGNLERQRCV